MATTQTHSLSNTTQGLDSQHGQNIAVTHASNGKVHRLCTGLIVAVGLVLASVIVQSALVLAGVLILPFAMPTVVLAVAIAVSATALIALIACSIALCRHFNQLPAAQLQPNSEEEVKDTQATSTDSTATTGVQQQGASEPAQEPQPNSSSSEIDEQAAQAAANAAAAQQAAQAATEPEQKLQAELAQEQLKTSFVKQQELKQAIELCRNAIDQIDETLGKTKEFSEGLLLGLEKDILAARSQLEGLIKMGLLATSPEYTGLAKRLGACDGKVKVIRAQNVLKALDQTNIQELEQAIHLIEGRAHLDRDKGLQETVQTAKERCNALKAQAKAFKEGIEKSLTEPEKINTEEDRKQLDEISQEINKLPQIKQALETQEKHLAGLAKLIGSLQDELQIAVNAAEQPFFAGSIQKVQTWMQRIETALKAAGDFRKVVEKDTTPRLQELFTAILNQYITRMEDLLKQADDDDNDDAPKDLEKLSILFARLHQIMQVAGPMAVSTAQLERCECDYRGLCAKEKITCALQHLEDLGTCDDLTTFNQLLEETAAHIKEADGEYAQIQGKYEDRYDIIGEQLQGVKAKHGLLVQSKHTTEQAVQSIQACLTACRAVKSINDFVSQQNLLDAAQGSLNDIAINLRTLYGYDQLYVEVDKFSDDRQQLAEYVKKRTKLQDRLQPNSKYATPATIKEFNQNQVKINARLQEMQNIYGKLKCSESQGLLKTEIEQISSQKEGFFKDVTSTLLHKLKLAVMPFITPTYALINADQGKLTIADKACVLGCVKANINKIDQVYQKGALQIEAFDLAIQAFNEYVAKNKDIIKLTEDDQKIFKQKGSDSTDYALLNAFGKQTKFDRVLNAISKHIAQYFMKAAACHAQQGEDGYNQLQQSLLNLQREILDFLAVQIKQFPADWQQLQGHVYFKKLYDEFRLVVSECTEELLKLRPATFKAMTLSALKTESTKQAYEQLLPIDRITTILKTAEDYVDSLKDDVPEALAYKKRLQPLIIQLHTALAAQDGAQAFSGVQKLLAEIKQLELTVDKEQQATGETAEIRDVEDKELTPFHSFVQSINKLIEGITSPVHIKAKNKKSTVL